MLLRLLSKVWSKSHSHCQFVTGFQISNWQLLLQFGWLNTTPNLTSLGLSWESLHTPVHRVNGPHLTSILLLTSYTLAGGGGAEGTYLQAFGFSEVFATADAPFWCTTSKQARIESEIRKRSLMSGSVKRSWKLVNHDFERMKDDLNQEYNRIGMNRKNVCILNKSCRYKSESRTRGPCLAAERLQIRDKVYEHPYEWLTRICRIAKVKGIWMP